VIERAECVADELRAAVERAQVRLQKGMTGAQLTGERLSGVGRAAEADTDARAGEGERNRDRFPDPGTGSGDDGAQTGERRPSGLRDQWPVAGRRYPSAPPANG
jgi:hypothetical protein